MLTTSLYDILKCSDRELAGKQDLMASLYKDLLRWKESAGQTEVNVTNKEEYDHDGRFISHTVTLSIPKPRGFDSLVVGRKRRAEFSWKGPALYYDGDIDFGEERHDSVPSAQEVVAAFFTDLEECRAQTLCELREAEAWVNALPSLKREG